MGTFVIDLIAAARPNFMKVAPLHSAMRQECGTFKPRLIHTGQHYDENMSGAFFRDLGLPEPTAHLGVGSGTHAEQTGRVMIAYEKWCMEAPPDLAIVVGDVNSTLACALAATKLQIPVAHLEAGLRSGDRNMPEEVNRLATDAIADLLWTPSTDADENLLREGVSPDRICRVGNIMIDALEMCRTRIEGRHFPQEFGLETGAFGVVTLHRPSNVDDVKKLGRMVDMLRECAEKLPIVFPVHPRTRKCLSASGFWESLKRARGLHVLDPVGYVDFMSFIFSAAVVITDSGGVQEETTYLGIPCITLRENTERPITITSGTNRLMQPTQVPEAIDRILRGAWPAGLIPDLWDGKTAGRIVESLKKRLGVSRDGGRQTA